MLAANLYTVPALGATPPAGADLNIVVSALAAMKLLLINGMSRMIRPTWFFAPNLVEYIGTRRDSVGGFYYKDEVARGTLLGYPIFTSQQIPTNLGAGSGSEFYLVDMADVPDRRHLERDGRRVRCRRLLRDGRQSGLDLPARSIAVPDHHRA